MRTPVLPHIATLRTHVETITNASRLDALAVEWSLLWKHDPRATVFQTPEWLQTWWQHFGNGQLRALAVRRNEQLIGLLPLYVRTEDPTGTRTLQFMGIGLSDYLDALIAPGADEECFDAWWAHLSGQHDCDRCHLQHLRRDSPLLLDAFDQHQACPVVTLPAQPEQLGEVASSALLKHVDYCRRKARDFPNTQFEAVNAKNFSELFRGLIQLHRLRWNARGQAGTLDPAWRFHTEAAARLFARELLRLYAWRVNGRLIAVLYGFLCGRHFYFYASGFDPEFEHLSPGSVLIAHAMEEAIREGATEFDFLRGAEAYKYRWGAHDRPLFQCEWQPA